MSNARFSITQAKAVSDSRVSDSLYRTLSALGVFSDKDGWCFPAQETIAVMVGKTRQTINEHIAQLVELGYLEKRAQFKEDGGQTSNLYRLIFDFPASTRQGVSALDLTGGVGSRLDTNDPTNDPINGANARQPDLVDAELVFHLRPKAIKDAFAKFFKLTPNWDAKYNRQYLEWMVQQKVTPEQVEQAANLWRTDKRFNWQVPTPKLIQEHWLELTGKTEDNSSKFDW